MVQAHTDYLLNFKANLIMGHMIPGGTGFFEFDKRVRKYIDPEAAKELEFVFTD